MLKIKEEIIHKGVKHSVYRIDLGKGKLSNPHVLEVDLREADLKPWYSNRALNTGYYVYVGDILYNARIV